MRLGTLRSFSPITAVQNFVNGFRLLTFLLLLLLPSSPRTQELWLTERIIMGRRNLDELSIDDLMRMQEGPPRKRKRAEVRREDLHSEADSDASSSQRGSDSAEESGMDAGTEDGSAGENEDDSDEEGDEDEDTPAEDMHSDPDIEQLSRFSNSRVSSQTITSLLVTPKQSGHPSKPTKPTSASFEDFGISAALLSALHKMSIRAPTEIQTVCIPPLLQGE